MPSYTLISSQPSKPDKKGDNSGQNYFLYSTLRRVQLWEVVKTERRDTCSPWHGILFLQFVDNQHPTVRVFPIVLSCAYVFVCMFVCELCVFFLFVTKHI